MKRSIYITLITLLIVPVYADECTVIKASFKQEEQAYDTVSRIAVAGKSSYEIIGRFVEEGTLLLTKCPKVYSLDRQYTLKRKLKKARRYQQSYKVFTQGQVSSWARSHPEEIVLYKWGTVKSSP